MPGYSLHQLDQRSVAIEFPFSPPRSVVKGHGRLVATQPSGQALHVAVQGTAEEFEIVFDVDQFSGSIEHGERHACDFAIRLDSAWASNQRSSAAA